MFNINEMLNRRKPTNPSYYVVMQDFGRHGLEANVHPEDTRRQIIQGLFEGQYTNVQFIHHIADGFVDDVTAELLDAAEALARESAERAWDRFCENAHGGADPLTIRKSKIEG